LQEGLIGPREILSIFVLKMHFWSLLQASLSWLRQAHVLQVSKMCQPLDDLRDLAGSDSVDTFVLSYTSLLQVCPPALHGRAS
jgi:hypothetical protein